MMYKSIAFSILTIQWIILHEFYLYPHTMRFGASWKCWYRIRRRNTCESAGFNVKLKLWNVIPRSATDWNLNIIQQQISRCLGQPARHRMKMPLNQEQILLMSVSISICIGFHDFCTIRKRLITISKWYKYHSYPMHIDIDSGTKSICSSFDGSVIRLRPIILKIRHPI